MKNDVLTPLNRWLGKKLPAHHTIWLKRFRREEHSWQRKQRLLRGHRASPAAGEILMLKGEPFTVVSRAYDASQAVEFNLQSVVTALETGGVEFVRLARSTPFKPIIATKLNDLRATLRALSVLTPAAGWSIRLETATHRRLSLNAALRNECDVFRIVLSRSILGPSGHLMSTASERVVIEPWEQVGEGEPRADGSLHLPGTVRRRIDRRGTLVEYLTPERWREAASGNEHAVMLPAPHLYQVTEPIDLVYTWVNGDDPAWRKRKAQAAREVDEHLLNETALSESRFKSRDELKYSLRSVEAYANWVNHIYIVTDGQVPDWLDTRHPKITIVDHRDIFNDAAVLPVFNSHAIESQLHHIEGLSEQYLYMNDDLFFMRPVRPETFFTSNGLSKFFPSRAPLDIHERDARDLPVLSAAKQGRAFMLEIHDRTVTNKFKHTPHPQLRSVVQSMEDQYPDMFRDVAASKFRAPDDYSIASALYHFHAYAERRAVPGKIAYDYVDIGSENAALRLEWFSYQRALDVICLNDTDLEDSEQSDVSRLLTHFLERRFSVKSSFELEHTEVTQNERENARPLRTGGGVALA